MTVLAVVSTPNSADAPDSAPRRIVTNLPSIELNVIQFERQGTKAVPYVWMSGATKEAFETVLVNDSKITNYEKLEQTDSGILYKVAWEVDSPLIHCMMESNGAVIRARGTSDEWQLNIWFESSSEASAFHQCCNVRGIPLNVNKLTSLGDFVTGESQHITNVQKKTLTLAYKEGYFEKPRRISQRELADKIGISSSAVGGRIRRGTANLIKEILLG